MYEYEIMYADDMSLIVGFDDVDEADAWIAEHCTYDWGGDWDADARYYYNGELIEFSY